MILAARVDSFKVYLDNPAVLLELAWPCPLCRTRSLSRHGAVRRWVFFAGGARERITVFRLRCRPCRITATLLPDFLLPYLRYAAEVVEAGVNGYLGDAGSYRAVALAVAGATVPPDLPPSALTDAIESLKLKPGYQRVSSWVARIVRHAAKDVAEAAAWITTRVPTSTIVDQLTVPLPGPARPGGLDDARMLARIFAAVPELNPAGTTWIAAWLRFVAFVARRPPWRGPPRPPPEPRSS